MEISKAVVIKKCKCGNEIVSLKVAPIKVCKECVARKVESRKYPSLYYFKALIKSLEKKEFPTSHQKSMLKYYKKKAKEIKDKNIKVFRSKLEKDC